VGSNPAIPINLGGTGRRVAAVPSGPFLGLASLAPASPGRSVPLALFVLDATLRDDAPVAANRLRALQSVAAEQSTVASVRAA
jgi:hypothetical protein